MPFSCKLVPPPYAKEKLNKGESNLNKTTESETLPEKGSNHGRAEGLPVEQNMLLCYELVAKFASFILGHVHELCKQRDCSDECKEAIQSLIYAAARFFDLPELRELRTLFTVIDISKEFVENLRQDPALKEMKIQLLHDLAQEFSVELDNKALEQRLNSQSQLHDEKPKHDPENDHDDVKWHKNNDDPPPPDDYSQKAKQHQQTKLTDKGAAWDDEEERILYELLIHYSKKQFPHESGTGKAYSKAYPLQRQEYGNGHTKSNSHVPFVSGISLPHQDTTLMETLKTSTHGRATSSVPEMLRTARHVHPCLPDYDDLTARFAALRKTTQAA